MANGFINTLVAFLIAGATLSFSFKAVEPSGKVMYEGSGTVLAIGDSYRMETPQMLVVSDGETKGIYQKEIDEIVLQKVASAGAADNATLQGIMDNPFAILQHAGKFYTVTTYKGGKKATSGAPGALPDKIELRAASGAVYTIGIMGAKKEDCVDASSFVLNPDDFPTAVVTDLR
jgi:hypothetical protein